MSAGSFKNIIYNMCLEIMYLIYMYKNNPEWSICHETKTKQSTNNLPWKYAILWSFKKFNTAFLIMITMLYETLYKCFVLLFRLEQDVLQGQFLSGMNLDWELIDWLVFHV